MSPGPLRLHVPEPSARPGQETDFSNLRIVVRPVIRDGAVVARPLMNLSSSFDHRIVDGALAAAFVQGLRERLEHPATLFVE